MTTERRKRVVPLPAPFDHNKLNKWLEEGGVYVQPKIDGIRATWKQGECLVSSTGLPILTVPHLTSILNGYLWDKITIPLDGELFIPKQTFETLCSVVNRNDTLTPECYAVEYCVFDSPLCGYGFATRYSALQRDVPNEHASHVFLCETVFCKEHKEVYEKLEDYIARGYEGIIIRRSTHKWQPASRLGMMKYKPTKEDLYTCVGSEEEVDKNGVPKGTLGSLLVEDTEGTRFSVGTGFTAKQRHNLWIERTSLLGKKILVKYQEKTDAGACRFPVYVEMF